MARMRSVKPEFWTDPDMADLSRDARLLYIGLWNLSDEHGRVRGDARYLKGQLFAYDDDLTADCVAVLVDELEKAGKVLVYAVDGKDFLHLPTLAKHQRLEPERVPSRLPAPPSTPDADSSEPRADESEHIHAPPNDLALSREHVAGSMKQAAGTARAARAPESAADEKRLDAARLIADATGLAPAEAFAVAAEIDRQRRPRNLPGLVRTLIESDDLGAFVVKAQARAPCERHDRYPCAECRSEQLALGSTRAST